MYSYEHYRQARVFGTLPAALEVFPNELNRALFTVWRGPKDLLRSGSRDGAQTQIELEPRDKELDALSTALSEKLLVFPSVSS
jgi:hypothetical protein